MMNWKTRLLSSCFVATATLLAPDGFTGSTTADEIPDSPAATETETGVVPGTVSMISPGVMAGTLGRTYYRRSHPVPADKHPRTAMLAVRDRGNIPVVTVVDMSGFRLESGIWLLESSRPLDPGVAQVVRVEARHSPQEVEPYDCRFVRLIPGRIVYLDF